MGHFKKLGDLCVNTFVNTYPEDLQSKLVKKSKTLLYIFVKRKNVNLKKKIKKIDE